MTYSVRRNIDNDNTYSKLCLKNKEKLKVDGYEVLNSGKIKRINMDFKDIRYKSGY